jgi:hypothetical protein
MDSIWYYSLLWFEQRKLLPIIRYAVLAEERM